MRAQRRGFSPCNLLSPRRRPPRTTRPLPPRRLARRNPPAAHLPLRRNHPPLPHHPQILRLHQNRRRLRPPLHLLRHPQPARQIPFPPLRIRSRRSPAARRPRRPGDHPHRPGHHLLRRRPRPQRRPRHPPRRARRIEGLRWLRFLYAYPNRITGRLLDTIARHDNICKYLDVPLQHASPDVLKTMKRGAGADIFLKTLEKVRAAVPGIALRTTFIVGFPGESLRDFEFWRSSSARRNSTG
jgi:hypothetical protein